MLTDTTALRGASIAEGLRPPEGVDPNDLQAVTAAVRAMDRAEGRPDNAGALQKGTAKRAALAAAAAAAAPAAIAAATTDHERDLITRIFDAVPGVLSASQAHSIADATNADDELALHDVWDAARAALEGLTLDLMELRPESPADAVRRILLFRQIMTFTEGAPGGGSLENLFEEDVRHIAVAAVQALERLAAPVADRAAWDAALSAYRAAEARLAITRATSTDLDAQIDATAPEWLFKPRHVDGKPILIADTLKRFDFVTKASVFGPAEHPGLIDHRAEFIDWLAANAEAMAARDAADLLYDEQYDALCDVERTLIETPAPDLEAVALKQAMLARELDDDKRGYDDPIYFAVARDMSFVSQSWPAHIFTDLQRLAGRPIPDFEPFQPRLWLNRLKETGGDVKLGDDGDSFVAFKAAPPDGDMEAATAILAELEVGRAKEVLLRYLQELS